MPWKIAPGQQIKNLASSALARAEEAKYRRIDRFIVDWMNSLTPQQLVDALVTDKDPRDVLLDEQFKRDIWKRVPFLADNLIYRYATKERIRDYVINRLPTVAPAHAQAIAQNGLTERLVEATRLVIKELFD